MTWPWTTALDVARTQLLIDTIIAVATIAAVGIAIYSAQQSIAAVKVQIAHQNELETKRSERDLLDAWLEEVRREPRAHVERVTKSMLNHDDWYYKSGHLDDKREFQASWFAKWHRAFLGVKLLRRSRTGTTVDPVADGLGRTMANFDQKLGDFHRQITAGEWRQNGYLIEIASHARILEASRLLEIEIDRARIDIYVGTIGAGADLSTD